jgi:quinolinate synthase
MNSEPSSFPSLLIRADELVPQGAFAEAQADYLAPDPAITARLGKLLEAQRCGVVAHFYMDPELQGVLSGCDWPHIRISDSLLMADAAIKMVEAGAEKIVVLGVDFMSENVRAMLDAAGHDQVPVYRVVAEPIGCSLAESAEAKAYGAYLTKASQTPRSLHVIYINTSLSVKARAHHLVPTITCTSSNVVPTVLQAFAQVPDLHLWFGPDTYMGHNLREMFQGISQMHEAAVRELHPEHTPATIASLLERFHTFEQGTCVVHHMFGADVAARVERDYADCFVTAHLEVPGEMFRLALTAQQNGNGVVGSTSNILSFIAEKVNARVAAGKGGRLRFVLGTEAGMITAIVRRVQKILDEHRAEGAPSIEAEIVFPVASEAVAATDDAELGVVPGVAGGEGCSTAGGCATCPYMKMNSLDALTDLLERLGTDEPDKLIPLFPRKYAERIDGRSMADLGGEPILHMRGFQREGCLPQGLVDDIAARAKRTA